MAYFAELDDDNIVIRIVSVSNNDAPDPAPNDQAGNDFLASIGLAGRWVQTSFNATFRKHPAGIGYTYDDTLDAFIPPQPFPSWTLNTTTCLWEPPVPIPTNVKGYEWDETNQEWVLVE